MENEAAQYRRIKFLGVMRGGNLAGVHVRAGQCACRRYDEMQSNSVSVAFCLSLLSVAEKREMTSCLGVKAHPLSTYTSSMSAVCIGPKMCG